MSFKVTASFVHSVSDPLHIGMKCQDTGYVHVFNRMIFYELG